MIVYRFRKAYFLLFIGLTIFYFAQVTFLRDKIHFNNNEVRLFNDNFDRGVYYKRGKWVVLNQIPYQDTFSEYPQIGTYTFSLPFLIHPKIKDNKILYGNLFSMLMLILFFIAAAIIYRLLKIKKYIFVLLLPASIYFTYNRFDIEATLFVVFSLFLFSRKKYISSAVLLSFAVFTKWYPILIFPFFLLYLKNNRKLCLKLIMVFIGTCSFIVLPTIISAGWDNFIIPYSFHNERISDPSSASGIIIYLLKINPKYLIKYKLIFYFFQFSGLLLIPYVKWEIRNFKMLARMSAITITLFILFARINSPQWILWTTPLFLLSAEDKWDIILLVLFDISTYCYFPIAYDLYGEFSLVTITCIIIKTILYVALVLKGMYNLKMHTSRIIG